jgi:hypothetical protein
LAAVLALSNTAHAQQQPPAAAAPAILRAAINNGTGQIVIEGNNLVAGTGVPKVDVHGSPLTMTSYQTGQIIGDFSTVWRGREEHNACR